MEEMDLPALIERVKAGDPAAAQEFVRRFGPQIRRAIRTRGTGQRLQRVLDSEDLCQSVLRRFWAHLPQGAVPVDDPTKLLKWLVTVARNRHREVLRREGADKRGGDLQRDPGSEVMAQVAESGGAVGAELEQREFLDQLLARLGEEERTIARLRAEGMSWESIAEQFGQGVEALRKRYQRAVSRIIAELDGR